MVLNIKILMILFILSFVLLLYKLNKFSRVILIEASDRVLENVEINERHLQPSPVLVNYFSDLLNKRPNLLTYPLLMTTSFIYNKKESINEESYELDHIKQTIELKKLSMSMALLVFLVISIEWNNLDVFSSAYQKGFSVTLPLGIHSGIILGYDHLSIPFILLLSFIFPIVFMSNWTTIKLGEMKYYLTTILASHYFLIIVFLVIDILMFYISFEIILPFFFILLGMFGGVQKFRAMYYLFLYTLWGSLFMLLEFLTKIGENGTGVMGLLEDLQLSSSWGLLGSIGIILAFSIKTPIVPFHLWLPLAHGDANVSGSIVLASIVLKMALYGFIRILIFILLLAFTSVQLTMFSIFIFSLLFASTTTMRQNDLKVLVAYSSVAHMGSTLLGGFSNSQFGIFGSILFSIAHGVVSPALFIFVGALFYDRIGSRIMNYLKGLVILYPTATAMLLMVVFGNMGTPLTANFIAELECILATFMANVTMGILAAISIILSACYSIFMFNRISTGSISPYLTTAPDTNKKEFSMIMPLITLMVLFGIIPALISNPTDLGLSHNVLDVTTSIVGLIILILSILSNFILLYNIIEIGKHLFNISSLKIRNLFTDLKNKLVDNINWSESCFSSLIKDDSDNGPKSNTGTSYNNPLLNSGLSIYGLSLELGSDTRRTSLVEEQLMENPDQAGANNMAQTEILLQEGGAENPPQGEGAENPPQYSQDTSNSGEVNQEKQTSGEETSFAESEDKQSESNNTPTSSEGKGGGVSDKMTNTDIDLDSSELNVSISNRQDYSNSDLCLIENNNNLIPPREIYDDHNSSDWNLQFGIVNLLLEDLIIISCGFAIFIGLLYIIYKIHKLLIKPQLVYIDNKDQDSTKIKYLNIDFTKSSSTRPDFVRSGAPSPETRPGTPDNEANGNGNDSSSDKEGSGSAKERRRPSSGRNGPDRNGNGSSPSGEGNGSNNQRPSGEDGSISGRP